MNKLELAIQFTSDILRSGICDAVDVNPEVIFKLIEEIEEIAVKKGLIKLSHCPKCNQEIVVSDLRTTGSAMFRATCGCKTVGGKNIAEIYNEWLT